ncbi:hypothetical protein [Emticicia oligotrophica]|nr:hypothetical protein [Emticicia oligotrophica]
MLRVGAYELSDRSDLLSNGQQARQELNPRTMLLKVNLHGKI